MVLLSSFIFRNGSCTTSQVYGAKKVTDYEMNGVQQWTKQPLSFPAARFAEKSGVPLSGVPHMP
jgi:hypothetical protein